jgi:hypothetical protein
MKPPLNQSLPSTARLIEPPQALRVVRTHWSIENRQHWLLDVAFAEDRIHTPATTMPPRTWPCCAGWR